MNAMKCVFGQSQVKLLGYVVSADGLQADPDKVKAISLMDRPQTVKEVQSFLGMTNYYRTLMPDYARKAEPLIRLTKKGVKFVWSQEQDLAFQTLKDLLISHQVMAHPQTDKPYILYTDACDYAVGAVLYQKDDSGVERPIAYFSKQLEDA